MKKFFVKDNFILSTFDSKQKKQSLIIALISIAIFIMCSFTFFNFMYVFADCVGSIVSGSADVAVKDFFRSLPLVLSFLMCYWTLMSLHAYFRNIEDRRMRSVFKDGIVITVFAGVNILYILSMRISGTYLSLVEGSPSPLFPLDAILFSLPFLAYGIFSIIYSKKLSEKLPYVVPSRGPIVSRARFIYCVGITLWSLIALFGFAAFWLSVFIYDFKHEFVFFGIATLIIYLLPLLLFAVWEFYFNELKEEKRKEFLFPLSLVSLGASLVSMILYFVSLSTGLDAPSNAGFGMFPVAFAASVNIATLVVVLTPLIISIVSLIKGLKLRKNQ